MAKYTFEQFLSRFDAFNFEPRLRASSKIKGVPTPLGVLSTFIIAIIGIILLTIRYQTLVNHTQTLYQTLIDQEPWPPLEPWEFVVGEDFKDTGFNMKFAFGVYNATDFKQPQQFERLGRVRAYMFMMRTDADGGIIKKKVDLKLHLCNMQDVDLFNELGSYQSKIALFYCLDRGQKISMLGDWAQDNQNVMIWDFQRCNQTELVKVPGYENSTCYTKDEQRSIMNNLGTYLIFSTQEYVLNEYDVTKVIEKTARQYPNYGNVEITQEANFLFNRKYAVLKDGAISNMLASDIIKPYVDISYAPSQQSFNWMSSNSHIRVTLSLCLDVTRNYRVAYTITQLITDVGGFLSCLMILCTLVLKQGLRLETVLENKMMNTVFRRRMTGTMKLGYVNVNYRQYVVAVMSACFFLRRPRHELWRRVAMRRLNRELDVTRFMRKQYILEGLYKGITSQGQRKLLERQYSLMVPGAHDGDTTSESNSDYEFVDFNPTTTLDHVAVNRLRKNTRNSHEPVDKHMVLQLLQKVNKKGGGAGGGKFDNENQVEDEPDQTYDKSMQHLFLPSSKPTIVPDGMQIDQSQPNQPYKSQLQRSNTTVNLQPQSKGANSTVIHQSAPSINNDIESLITEELKEYDGKGQIRKNLEGRSNSVSYPPVQKIGQGDTSRYKDSQPRYF